MLSTTPDQRGTPTGRIEMDTFNFAMLFCPTYMNFEQDEKYPHARNSENVFFRGLAERVILQNGNVGDLYHRRIVFWSNERFTQGAPLQSLVAPTLYFRPLRPLVLAGADEAIPKLLFKGIRGVDWAHYITAPIDTKRITLVSDKIKKIPVKFAAQNFGETDIHAVGSAIYKRSTFVNKTIPYDDEESGARDVERDEFLSDAGAPWAARGGTSPGNLYVFDLFNVNASITTDIIPEDDTYQRPVISFDTTVYWHEK